MPLLLLACSVRYVTPKVKGLPGAEDPREVMRGYIVLGESKGTPSDVGGEMESQLGKESLPPSA